MAFAPAQYLKQIYNACRARGIAAGELSGDEDSIWGTAWVAKDFDATAHEMLSKLPLGQRVTFAKFAAKRGDSHLLMASFRAGVHPLTTNSNGGHLLLRLYKPEEFVEVEKYLSDGYTPWLLSRISHHLGEVYSFRSMEQLNQLGRLKNRLDPFALVGGIALSQFSDDKLPLLQWAIKQGKSGKGLPPEKKADVFERTFYHAIPHMVGHGQLKALSVLLKNKTLAPPTGELIDNGVISPIKMRLDALHGSSKWAAGRGGLGNAFHARFTNSIKEVVRTLKKCGIPAFVTVADLLRFSTYADPDLTRKVCNLVRKGAVEINEKRDLYIANQKASGNTDAYRMKELAQQMSVDVVRHRAHHIKNNTLDQAPELQLQSLRMVLDLVEEQGVYEKVAPEARLSYVDDLLECARTQKLDLNSAWGVSVSQILSEVGKRACKNVEVAPDVALKVFCGHGNSRQQQRFCSPTETEVLIHFDPKVSQGEDALLFSLTKMGVCLHGQHSFLNELMAKKASAVQAVLMGQRLIEEVQDAQARGDESPLVVPDGFPLLVGVLQKHGEAGLSKQLLSLSDQHGIAYAMERLASHPGNKGNPVSDIDLVSFVRQMEVDGCSVNAALSTVFKSITCTNWAFDFKGVYECGQALCRELGSDLVRGVLRHHLSKAKATYSLKPWSAYLLQRAVGLDGNFVDGTDINETAQLLRAMSFPMIDGKEDARKVFELRPQAHHKRLMVEFMEMSLSKGVARCQKLVSDTDFLLDAGVPAQDVVLAAVERLGHLFGRREDIVSQPISEDDRNLAWTDLQKVFQDHGIDFRKELESWLAKDVLKGCLSNPYDSSRSDFFIDMCSRMNHFPSLLDIADMENIDRLNGRIHSAIEHFELEKHCKLPVDEVAAAPSATIRRRAGAL